MIIPSIDLADGKAVQLKQGREKVLEREDPERLAEEFFRFGEVAVIDLDAALGKGDNEKLIRRICAVADCRVGGGIRSLEKAESILSMGAEKIIIGTKAFQGKKVNQPFLRKICDLAGRERIILALDTLNGEVVTRGWRHKTGMKWDSVVKELEPYVSEFLFTCVEKEGLMQGTNRDAVKRMRDVTARPVTAAGGVSTLEEIFILSQIGVNIQLGMALYTGEIRLPGAFAASLNWGKGLIPTVTVDESSQVLMLAYSNKESLLKTFATGKAWYFSRSRGKLWMKGETSGNTQEFLKVRSDCDQDALVLTVRQKGLACHTGSYSCFGARKFSLQELHDVVRERMENRSPHSYTASLTKERLAAKIREEARELVEAAGSEAVIWEAADLFYFVTVLLAQNGASLGDVLKELKRRRRTRSFQRERRRGRIS
jgi:phosphoribosyl-ATP pyrophosphohydrolase/phosphoribosyl-AMP cyclohydrolase